MYILYIKKNNKNYKQTKEIMIIVILKYSQNVKTCCCLVLICIN